MELKFRFAYAMLAEPFHNSLAQMRLSIVVA